MTTATFNGNLYRVEAVDHAAKEITLRPIKTSVLENPVADWDLNEAKRFELSPGGGRVGSEYRVQLCRVIHHQEAGAFLFVHYAVEGEVG